MIGGDDWENGVGQRGHTMLADVVKGAIAGAVATWAMGQVTSWLYERESSAARRREEGARGGQSAYETAAGKLADAAEVELSTDERQKAGQAIHWVLGIGAGAAYAAARRRWPAAARAGGLPFGAGFFMAADELMNPLLGLTPGPAAFPRQAHARGLGGHLAFGLVTEGMLRLLDRATVPHR